MYSFLLAWRTCVGTSSVVALRLFGATTCRETTVILYTVYIYNYSSWWFMSYESRQSVAVMNQVQQYGLKLFGKWSKESSNCLLHKVIFGHFCYKAIFELSSTSRIPPTDLQCYKSDVLSGFRSNKINKAAGILQTRSFKHLVRKGESCWGRGGRGGRGAHENHEKGWFLAGRLESLIRAQWNELPVAHLQWWFCKDVVGCRRMPRFFRVRGFPFAMSDGPACFISNESL